MTARRGAPLRTAAVDTATLDTATLDTAARPAASPDTAVRPAATFRTSTSAPGRTETYALASLFLDYPDAELLAQRERLAGLAHSLPGGRLLARFADWFAATPPATLTETYVRTFDLRRKSSLYTTYFEHGDTRARGMALVTLKHRYRMAGFAASAAELPDYLPTMLQFAAVTGPEHGETALRQARTALEVIHRSLAEINSPYVWVVQAVLQTLGPLSPKSQQRIDALVAAGPPVEQVGAGDCPPGGPEPSPTQGGTP